MLHRGEPLLHPPAELLEGHPHEKGTFLHRAHDGVDDVPQVALQQLQAALPHPRLRQGPLEGDPPAGTLPGQGAPDAQEGATSS